MSTPARDGYALMRRFRHSRQTGLEADDGAWQCKACLMQQTWGIEAEKHGAQFVVAIFDDWEALHAVLVDLEARATLRSGAVLHARTDIPPHVSTLGLLKEMAQLHFVRSRQHIACTVGRLSQELSDRLAKGARSLA